MTVRAEIRNLIKEYEFTATNKHTKDLLTSKVISYPVRAIAQDLIEFYMGARKLMSASIFTMTNKHSLAKKELIAYLVSFEVANPILRILGNNLSSAVDQTYYIILKGVIDDRLLSVETLNQIELIMDDLTASKITESRAREQVTILRNAIEGLTDEMTIIDSILYILD